MALRRIEHNRSKAVGDKLKQENLYSETQANELKKTQDTLSGKGSMQNRKKFVFYTQNSESEALSNPDNHRKVAYMERGENLSPSPEKAIRIKKHNQELPQASSLNGNIIACEKDKNNKRDEAISMDVQEKMTMAVQGMKPSRINSDALETINKRVQSAAFPRRNMSNARRSDMLP